MDLQVGKKVFDAPVFVSLAHKKMDAVSIFDQLFHQIGTYKSRPAGNDDVFRAHCFDLAEK